MTAIRQVAGANLAYLFFLKLFSPSVVKAEMSSGTIVAITHPDPVHVDSYIQIARVLLRNLLDISVDEPGTSPPHSSLGLLVLKWGAFEQALRRLAKWYLPKSKHEFGPALNIIDGLVAKRILDGSFRSRVDKVAKSRNATVHGVSVPTDVELRPLLREIDQLQTVLERVPEPQSGSTDNSDNNCGCGS